MSFPWRRDRPGQPPATQRDIRHRGTARHRRIPLQREQGARSRRRASRREEPAIYAWKSLRVPSARALPEAIARTVCQYTGVSWSPGVAGRLPAANPLSAVVTRRSGRLS